MDASKCAIKSSQSMCRTEWAESKSDAGLPPPLLSLYAALAVFSESKLFTLFVDDHPECVACTRGLDGDDIRILQCFSTFGKKKPPVQIAILSVVLLGLKGIQR